MPDRTRLNPAYRGTDRSGRVPCCAVSLEDLRRLYHSLQAKNDELFAGHMEGYVEGSERTHEQAEANVRDNLRVTVVVTGASGEQVVTHDVSGLEEGNLPSVVTAIALDSAWLMRIALQGTDPVNRCHVLFDFGRPPLVDLSNASGEPTGNGSNYRVTAANATWGVAVNEMIRSEFQGRTLGRAWLHAVHTYDALLLIVGFPSSLWGTWRLWVRLEAQLGGVTTGFSILGVLYLFIVLLYAFRALFGVARWLWPYVELRRERQGGAATFWRFVVGTVSLATLSSLVYDVVKTLLRN